ncbi:MAG: hypothetical protein QOJ91_1511 [Sphingomonadales bacterium]|jgi:hypothetical protein|nr:hypothetical protein [Sphingomonadales bacterium]
MRKGRIFAPAAAAAILLGAGWWFGSPWWTLWRMREAAEAGDAEALADYIDFPALRASTRRQLRRRLGPLGELVAGPALDAAISPQALSLALGKGRAVTGGGANGAGGAGSGDRAKVDVSRTGASEFRVEGRSSDLVFRRHGLGWKLEEIRLSSPLRGGDGDEA